MLLYLSCRWLLFLFFVCHCVWYSCLCVSVYIFFFFLKKKIFFKALLAVMDFVLFFFFSFSFFFLILKMFHSRQLLLCRVTLGKSFLQFSAMKMAHAPPGHHSVIGRPSTGGLNYAEYVVYRGEQVSSITNFFLSLSLFAPYIVIWAIYLDRTMLSPAIRAMNIYLKNNNQMDTEEDQPQHYWQF